MIIRVIEFEILILIKILGVEIVGVGLLIENFYNFLINILNDGFEIICL